MEDLPVNSIELEANAHPACDHSTLSGNTLSKKGLVITPWEKIKQLSKPQHIHELQKEPNTPKGASIPEFQKERNTLKDSRGIEKIK